MLKYPTLGPEFLEEISEMYLKPVVLFSGGLDSFLVGKLLSDTVPWLFIDYGQAYANVEDQVSNKLAQLHRRPYDKIVISKEPHKPDLAADDPNAFVPARNLMLASIAVAQGYETIYIGGVKDDMVCDNTPHAHAEMARVLSLFANKKINVIAPLSGTSKVEAIQQFAASEYHLKATTRAAYRDLKQTFSCFDPQGMNPCLKCKACVRWSVAMNAAGIKVPLPHRDALLDYVYRLHEYSRDRQWSLLKAMGRLYDIHEVDIDGVLTIEPETGSCKVLDWNHYYRKCKPKQDAIDCLHAWAGAGDIIILHTARPEINRDVTVKWLEGHNVDHHALLMEKLPVHHIYDDKALLSIP